MQSNKKTDIMIVGCGAAGLYCALNLPADKTVTIVTKSEASKSNSFLAQGGISVLRDEDDFADFFADTMKAGHYENDPDSVSLIIRASQHIIKDLTAYGVRFEMQNGHFQYTREGAHSQPRILFHKDETGKEITSHLLAAVRGRRNITLIENFTMTDLLCRNNTCYGIVGHDASGSYTAICADYTVLATGGIGGLFEHSTNYRHLTGDALALAVQHNIKLRHMDYIQIHPTTLYTEKQGRRFLISESVRGEGAVLLNAQGERFVDELLPRDVVADAIFKEMKKENSTHVWLSMTPIPEAKIRAHFPNIYEYCLEEGYDVTRQPIPVVPAQHYFMGGIDVDHHSKTSMKRLYAVGETACSGVHGRNRLASNSLLESLVFAKRSAENITDTYEKTSAFPAFSINRTEYDGYQERYKEFVLSEIEKEKYSHEPDHNEIKRR